MTAQTSPHPDSQNSPFTVQERRDKYIRLADELAQTFSPDPSRKTACLLLDTRGVVATVVDWGVNTTAAGLEATPDRLERPQKYGWLLHAEIKAIASAARRGISTQGLTAVINWFPCHPCASALVEAGIKTLLCLEPDWDDPKYSFKPAREALEDAGVEIIYAGTYSQDRKD